MYRADKSGTEAAQQPKAHDDFNQSSRIIRDDNTVHGSFCPLFLQIAAEIAAPLGRTSEIVMVSGKNTGPSTDLSHLAASMQPTMQTLTGINIAQVRSADHVTMYLSPL